MTTPREVLDFWFKETDRAAWFKTDASLDEAIRARFLDDVNAARAGTYDDWMSTGEGSLALLILLDQFPRNIFRGRAEAFASDAKARAVARAAVDKGFDLEVPAAIRFFFYLPFEHSEDMADQDRCVELMRTRIGDDPAPPSLLSYALAHREVIRRFGRFPGRNAALGRASTPEEEKYLETPRAF